MTDHRLLMAAVGFAGCSMPSYDRALWRIWRAHERVSVKRATTEEGTR